MIRRLGTCRFRHSRAEAPAPIIKASQRLGVRCRHCFRHSNCFASSQDSDFALLPLRMNSNFKVQACGVHRDQATGPQQLPSRQRVASSAPADLGGLAFNLIQTWSEPLSLVLPRCSPPRRFRSLDGAPQPPNPNTVESFQTDSARFETLRLQPPAPCNWLSN